MDLFDVYPVYDVTPVKGKGAYIYDESGKEYLDFYGGHAVISIGHTHPHYVHRLEDQIRKLAFYSNSIHNPLQKELAVKLGALSGLDAYRLFLCNSGAEANENALKLASFHTGRSKVVAFKKGFHGRTSAAVNVTDNSKIKAPINTHSPVEIIDYGDVQALEKTLNRGDVAAVILEGIQGIGGVYVAEASFLEQVDALCREWNTVLVLDEIQCGYGRSGRFFTFQKSKIQPGLITIAKGMGNGFPVGGVLIHPEFESTYGLLGTTFGGNHMACAAALAVLEVIEEEELMHNALKWGSHLMEGLKSLKGVREVRGEGLMIGIEFEFPIKDIRKKLIFENGVFTGSSSDPHTLRLLPPLGIGDRECNYAISALKSVLK